MQSKHQAALEGGLRLTSVCESRLEGVGEARVLQSVDNVPTLHPKQVHVMGCLYS